MIRTLRNSAIVWLALISAGVALADNSKISPDLLPLLNNSTAPVKVIIQYNSQQSTTCSIGLLGGLLCPVLNLVGGLVTGLLGVIDGAAAATLTGTDIIATSNQSNVAYISLDRPVRPMLDYTAGAVGASYAGGGGFSG